MLFLMFPDDFCRVCYYSSTPLTNPIAASITVVVLSSESSTMSMIFPLLTSLNPFSELGSADDNVLLLLVLDDHDLLLQLSSFNNLSLAVPFLPMLLLL